jgi:hypothetical protein
MRHSEIQGRGRSISSRSGTVRADDRTVLSTEISVLGLSIPIINESVSFFVSLSCAKMDGDRQRLTGIHSVHCSVRQKMVVCNAGSGSPTPRQQAGAGRAAWWHVPSGSGSVAPSIRERHTRRRRARSFVIVNGQQHGSLSDGGVSYVTTPLTPAMYCPTRWH